jgi:hypothetical protein
MTRADCVELWLHNRLGLNREQNEYEFTNRVLADGLGTTPADASGCIQAYLAKNNSCYVLARQGITSNSSWIATRRSRRTRLILRTYYRDSRIKFDRNIIHNLELLKTYNPKSARRIRRAIDDVEDALIELDKATHDL